MDGVGDGVDTPQTVMTTRAPALLKRWKKVKVKIRNIDNMPRRNPENQV